MIREMRDRLFGSPLPAQNLATLPLGLPAPNAVMQAGVWPLDLHTGMRCRLSSHFGAEISDTRLDTGADVR